MNSINKRIWAIGGGKGGTGKSFLTAALGTALAQAGNSVILVDANLAAPDLHCFLGIRAPRRSLLDVLKDGAAWQDVLAPTSQPRLRLLNFAGDEPAMADLAPGVGARMTAYLDRLEADFVVIDVGSGIASMVLDLFNLAHQPIAVTTPDPAAMRGIFRFVHHAACRRIQNRFEGKEGIRAVMEGLQHLSGAAQPRTMSSFVKMLQTREPEAARDITAMLHQWQPLMLVNMAASDRDLRRAEILETAASKLLEVTLRTCGLIYGRADARPCRPRIRIPDFDDQEDVMAQQIRQLALRLAAAGSSDPEERQVHDKAGPAAAPAMGLNDNLAFMGRAIHIQTEDLGAAGNCILTQVFCNGRVLLSTRAEYPGKIRAEQRQDQLCELMRAQHFNVMRQIESRKAKYPAAIA
jgi:flagellar biosynthesis protein FlhG